MTQINLLIINIALIYEIIYIKRGKIAGSIANVLSIILIDIGIFTPNLVAGTVTLNIPILCAVIIQILSRITHFKRNVVWTSIVSSIAYLCIVYRENFYLSEINIWPLIIVLVICNLPHCKDISAMIMGVNISYVLCMITGASIANLTIGISSICNADQLGALVIAEAILISVSILVRVYHKVRALVWVRI